MPSAIGRDGDTVAAPRAVAAAFSKRVLPGLTISGKQARAVFEKRGSSAPVPVSHSDLEALAHDAQLALYHVASGLLSQARQDVARAFVRADRALESLNRESLSAQQLLDACLFLARAHLMAHEHELALEQALECRRRVPEVQPDPKMHPPEVIGLVAEAEAELKLRNAGSLRVESEPDACTVYVNGRPLGRAPLELPQLSPGEYRLQAECAEGEIGRVHRVTVGSERVVQRIDTRLDAAVVTALELSLRYGSSADQQAYGAGDAVEVARVVGADSVLWVHAALDSQLVPAPGVVDLTRLRVRDGASIASVRIRASDAASQTAAVAVLQAGKSLDLTGAVPRALPGPTPLPDRPPDPMAQSARAQPSAALRLPARDEVSSEQPAMVPRADPPSLLVPIIVTGAGGALLIGGLITGLMSDHIATGLEKHCPGGQCDYPGFEQDVSDGKTLATTTAVLLVAGAVTAVTGVAWWLIANGERKPETRANAFCAPGLCGVSVAGRW